MNVLVLGSGGREHSICEAIRKSPLCDHLFVIPGNAGTAQLAVNIDGNPNDFDFIKQAVINNHIDFVVVGPEEPIVNGIYDYFKKDPELLNTQVLAPCAQAAALEGSKFFAKIFMKKYNIPTADFKVFNAGQYEQAKAYINSCSFPVVLKADGLAAGKGVTVARNQSEALNALNDAFVGRKFGKAGETLLIEEFLSGIELSVFLITDGKNYVLLPEAKDYKPVGDGNTGPNTGGMGAVSPVPFFNGEFKDKVISQIVEPTIHGLNAEKLDYHGFIFLGLINVGGNPYVIEYNVRLGDPETESILPRINSDFLELLTFTVYGKLNEYKMIISPKYSVSVMLVSGGYPGDYEKGKPIFGINELNNCKAIIAGAKWEQNNLITSGGRVLAVNGLAAELRECIDLVYAGVNKISFEKMHYRTDIGKDLLYYFK